MHKNINAIDPLKPTRSFDIEKLRTKPLISMEKTENKQNKKGPE